MNNQAGNQLKTPKGGEEFLRIPNLLNYSYVQ